MVSAMLGKSFLSLIIAVVAAGSANATDFTAETVVKDSEQEVVIGRIYVSELGVRTETQHQGNLVINIAIPSKGIMRTLFPGNHTYFELTAPPNAGAVEPGNVPCQPNAQLDCKNVGQCNIAGMDAQCWEVRPKEAPGVIRMWWDPNRMMPLRQENFDGSVMQATYQGTEQYERLTVERWELSFNSPNGQTSTGNLLFSPELKRSVHEQYADGRMRRLRNIELKSATPSLFELPPGYTKLDPSRLPRGQSPN
jgi:hypothetical protein